MGLRRPLRFQRSMAGLRSIASTDCQKTQNMPKLMRFGLLVAALGFGTLAAFGPASLQDWFVVLGLASLFGAVHA